MIVGNFICELFAKLVALFARSLRQERVTRSVMPTVMEPLGGLVFLNGTYEYDIPSGHSVAYVQSVSLTQGLVRIRLDNPITGTVGHTFTDASGLDIIRSADAGATLVDQVPAALKPSGGIQYEGASGNRFEIDLGATDQNVEVGGNIPNSSPAVTDPSQILTTDASDPDNVVVALDKIGGSITTLKILTNSNVAGTADGGTTVKVLTIVPTVHLNIDTNTATYSNVILGGGENASITGAEVHTGAGHSSVTVTAEDPTDVDGITSATIYEGTGANNALTVGAGGVATLSRPSGTLAESVVTVENGGNLTIASASSVDTLDVKTGGIGTISAASTFQSLNADGTVVVEAPVTIVGATGAGLLHFTASGNGSTSGPITSTGSVQVDASAAITITGPSSLNILTGNGTTEFTSTSGSSEIGTIDAASGTVKVDSGATLTVDSASSVDTLNVNGTAYLDGSTTITALTGSGTTEFTSTSGSSEIGTIDAASGTVKVDSGATLTVDSAASVGTLNVNGVAHLDGPTAITTLSGGGTTEFTSTSGSSTVGTIDAASGTVTIDTDASVTVHESSNIGFLNVSGTMILDQTKAGSSTGIGTSNDVHQLTIGSDGLLDLGKSFLYVDNTYDNTGNGGSHASAGGTDFGAIENYVNAVYDLNGSSNPNAGTIGDYAGRGGITSSVAAATFAGGGIGNISLIAYDGGQQDPLNRRSYNLKLWMMP